jgi:hypothetical protein
MAPRDHFRAHGRVPIRIDAVLRRQDVLVLPVTIRDLGFGGAGVDIADPTLLSSKQGASTPIELPTGLPVVLEVVAPVLWDPLYLPGKVMWNFQHAGTGHSARAGIRFDPLGAVTLLSLFEVLSSH